MPGIAGIIDFRSARENASAIGHMVKCMMHEPFYESGTYANEDLGLCVGWVNRAGSFADCLPVWNETNDICLIFYGEDFADRSEIAHLQARGHRFGAEDASYLVHLYEEIGPNFLAKLNGWFSGLLVDLRQATIVLFNDRYGLSRIYCHENTEGFYFASEAKALLKVLPTLRQVNYTSLGEFFSSGCPLQNKTLFSGVSLIPGGSAWTFSPNQRTRKENYFQPEVWQKQAPLSGEEYYEKLKETLSRVLPRYFRGKEQVAVSLTGGVDSRMVMAWASRPPGTLPCYTFGGMFRDCRDVQVARQVAKLCQHPHQTILVGRDFLADFPTLAEKTVYVTDGAMEVSGAPDLFANRKARQIAPVRLTGNFGGEILRSIVAFRPRAAHPGLFEEAFARVVGAAAETYSNEIRGNRLAFIAFKQVPWHHHPRLALEESQLTLRSPYLDNDLVALAFQAPAESTGGNELSLRLIAEGNRALSQIGTDSGAFYRPMTVVTYLRHVYQKFTFKAEYAYDAGMPQWLARLDHVAPLHLERLFLGRHKFYHFRLWYRNELSKYIKEVLLDSRARNRPYLNGACLERIVTHHIKGYCNYTGEIHRVLTSELMHRQLIEQR